MKELSVGDLEDSMSPPSPLAPFPSVSLPPVSLENLHEVENFVNETSKNIGYKDSFARAIIDSEDQVWLFDCCDCCCGCFALFVLKN